MAELANFPFKNQKTESDVNALYDCVPDALAAMLQYVTGQTFTGTEIKDAVYGANYQGGTDPARYVDYCTQHEVTFSPTNGSNTELVAAAHQFIEQGLPVLLTEVDPYLNPNPTGITHVCVWYKESPGELVAMDPFGGVAVTRTDAEWANTWLRDGQIWTMKTAMTIDLSNPTISQFFEANGPNWQRKGTNVVITGGILTWYRSVSFPGLAGLSLCGLPTANQAPGQDGKGNTVAGTFVQQFERGIVVYDPQHKLDSPPAAKGGCYLQHVESLYGLPAQIKQLQAELAATKTAPASSTPQAPA